MSNRKSHRVGERNLNRQGLTMEIVKYVNNKNVEIVFLETGEHRITRYLNFLHGNVAANLIDYPYIVVKEAKKYARITKTVLTVAAVAVAVVIAIKIFL